MVAPVSPLSTALPGVVMLAWTGLLGLNAQLAARLIPLRGEGYGAGFHTMLVSGVLVLLGTLMICPVFVPSRWRREGRDDAGSADAEDEDPRPPHADPAAFLAWAARGARTGPARAGQAGTAWPAPAARFPRPGVRPGGQLSAPRRTARSPSTRAARWWTTAG